ncbi:MAG: hypothetical protein LBV50_12435 [Novosphingobium sp.]|jgi:hypothetical protein|nr:hypothetical protein [Novosphingobium sp.]
MDVMIFKLLSAAVAGALLVVIVQAIRQALGKRRAQASFADPLDDEPLSPPAEAPEPEPEPMLPLPAGPDADFSAGVLARLERVFEHLRAEEITLAEYVLEVQGEQADIAAHLTALYARDADPAVIDDAIAARDAVRWCLDWAADRSAPRA